MRTGSIMPTDEDMRVTATRGRRRVCFRWRRAVRVFFAIVLKTDFNVAERKDVGQNVMPRVLHYPHRPPQAQLQCLRKVCLSKVFLGHALLLSAEK
jgi:hypothetical protein